MISASSAIFSQAHLSTQSHLSRVTDISVIEQDETDGTAISSGRDGFVIKWNEDGLGEHFQITDLEIKMTARSPDGEEIAVYETDGASINRVSVWNWRTLTRRYAFRFNAPVTSLAYSEKGTYVICGSAQVNGTVFINAKAGTMANNKLKVTTGAVSLAKTSASENSLAMYSPSGTLTYYNLKNGSEKAKFRVEPNLSQPCLFNNMVFFAGCANGNIYVTQAATGKLISTFPAEKPVLVASTKSQDLYYIVNTNRQFRLYKIQNDRNRQVIAPQLIRTFAGLKSGEKIEEAAIQGNTIYAGTNLGNVYKFDNAAQERVDSLLALTDNIYDKIYDIAGNGENFYFLTPNAIFLSSYDNGIVDKKGINPGYTNLIPYNGNIILWSRGSRKSVQLLSLANGSKTTIFSPRNTLQTLRLFGDSLISVEGNSTVRKIDIASKKESELYKGAGIQDAVLYNESDLYVAKSSATAPASPLIKVNIQTQETVPLSLKGEIAYALYFDKNASDHEIYGIVIGNNPSKKSATTVFAYDVNRKSSRTFLSNNDEDSNAFTYLYWPVLYTNIGKTQVRSYNLTSNRDFMYKRSASLPLKVARNQSRLVVLNRNGSISWYNPDMNKILADWYLTTDGQWFSFD